MEELLNQEITMPIIVFWGMFAMFLIIYEIIKFILEKVWKL